MRVASAMCLAEPDAKRRAVPGTAGMHEVRTNTARASTRRTPVGDLQSACARWRFASPGTTRETSAWDVSVGRKRVRLAPAMCLAEPDAKRRAVPGTAGMHGVRTNTARASTRRASVGGLPSACARWRFASPGTTRGTSAWALAWAMCLAEPDAKRRAVPGTAGMHGVRTNTARASTRRAPVGDLQSACARWRFASPGTTRETSAWDASARAWRPRCAWLSPTRSGGRCLAQLACTGRGRIPPVHRRGALWSAISRRRVPGGASLHQARRVGRHRGRWRGT